MWTLFLLTPKEELKDPLKVFPMTTLCFLLLLLFVTVETERCDRQLINVKVYAERRGVTYINIRQEPVLSVLKL